MYLSQSDYPDFPKNLTMDIFISSYNITDNIVDFGVNIFVSDSEQKYNANYIGYYYKDTKELKVSEKCRNVFVKEFVFNGKILVKNLFQDYILPEIYKLHENLYR
jgi:hypothetical protein